MNKLFTKIAGLTLGLAMAIGVGVAVKGNNEAVPAKAAGTDTLNRAFTGVSGTSYASWSKKEGTSGAVYAGNSAGPTSGTGANSIQLRSSSNSGIISTTSGGRLVSVSITWNSSTADARQINVYGSTTAYSAVSELYNNSTQGTLIGSRLKSDGDGTISVGASDNFTYVGIRSNSSAMYITSLSIVWEAYSPVVNTYTVTYSANKGTDAPQNVTDIDENDAKAFALADLGEMSRDGYEADGWATSADGNKAYDFGQTVDLTKISTNKTLALFAHWNKILTPNKIVFANENLENGVQYPTFGTASDTDESDRSYMSFTVGFSGGGNDGKYYDGGTGIRTYNTNGKITITAKDSKKLGSVTFTWSENYKPKADGYSVNDGEYDTSTGVWTGLSNSLVLSFTATSGDPWRLQSIEIALGTRKVTSIKLTPSALNVLSDNLSAQTIEVDVEPNDADVLALTIDKGEENVATVSKSSLNGDDTFTITGKGLTSGSQTITVSATDGSGVSTTLVLTAVDASAPVLVNITVDQTGLTHKTQYVGNAFDPEGLTFAPVYNKENPDPATITASDFTWSTLVAGENVVGTYKEDISIIVTIDTVTVKEDVLEVTVAGDELTNPDFLTTGSWNHDGITASAKYESGAAYAGSIEWGYSPETPAEMGVTDSGILTITATAGAVSKSVEVLVTVSKPREVVTTRVDTLDREFTGVPDQTGKTASYSDWSDKTGTETGFKYSGNSAGDKNSIQLRSNNSNSGIVTTISSGYIKSVKITFNSGSTSGRTVQVYGKNTAYAAASDLYNSDLQGTLLGTATYDGNTVSYNVEVEHDYFYVGIRSSSGAIYLDSVEFTFDYVHSASDVTAVDTFVAKYMHLDYDNGGKKGEQGEGNGSCAGYYDKDGENGAKYHFTQLTDAQKEIILKSKSVYGIVGEHNYTYDEIKERLSEWARINGDTLQEDGSFKSISINPISNLSEGNIAVLIAVISMVSLTALGGYFFLRKRKEQ